MAHVASWSDGREIKGYNVANENNHPVENFSPLPSLGTIHVDTNILGTPENTRGLAYPYRMDMVWTKAPDYADMCIG